jgi:hypothetical protein
MNLEEVIQSDKVDFSGIPSSYYLIGLLSAFENRFQAMADNMMQEISWKQFFAIICINMCKEPPTLKELLAMIETYNKQADFVDFDSLDPIVQSL